MPELSDAQQSGSTTFLRYGRRRQDVGPGKSARAAAISSQLCAELYDLEIIKDGIEDGPANTTRFLLLAREPFEGKGEKTSIIFATPHEAGRLYAVLRLFAETKLT